MTKSSLCKKLKADCVALGTYRPEFDLVISELADLLIRKENVLKAFEKSKESYIVTFTNGNTGTNSHIKLCMEMNNQSIKYMNELGLTPAGLKKLGDSLSIKKEIGLIDALKALG